MGFSRINAESRIISLADEFANNIILLYLFNDTKLYESLHLKLEDTYTTVQHTGCSLQRGKSLKAKDYYRFLRWRFHKKSKLLEPYVLYVINKNIRIKPRPNLNIDRMYEDIEDFYRILSRNLEDDRVWDTIEIYLT